VGASDGERDGERTRAAEMGHSDCPDGLQASPRSQMQAHPSLSQRQSVQLPALGAGIKFRSSDLNPSLRPPPEVRTGGFYPSPLAR
jgi:hypothetical protein